MNEDRPAPTLERLLAERRISAGTPEFERAVAGADREQLVAAGRALGWAIDDAIGRPRLIASLDDARRLVLAPLRRLGGGTAALGAASFHPSGFVREAAVRALADVWSGDELRFLLIRRNDWVEPVRRAATAALDARVGAWNAALFLPELALVERLAECGRDDHLPFVRAVRTLLRDEAATRIVLVGRIGATDAATRRPAFCALTDGVGAWPEDVRRAAQRSPDGTLRAAAVRAAAASDAGAAVAAALRDPFGAVVAQALFVADERLPSSDWAAALDRAVTDRRATVRSAARWILGKRGVSDFAERYRRLLATPDAASLDGALSGLGETGDASDAPRIADFLEHARPRIRRAAVAAWTRTADVSDSGPLVRAIEDSSRAVSVRARSALLGRPSRGAFDACARLVRDGRSPHVRFNALVVVAAGDWWSAGPVLLAACASDDVALSESARLFVRAWSTRRSVPAGTAGAIDALRAAVADVEDRIDAADLRRIRWILETERRMR